ncbi:MAG: hypothetical protein M1817_002417 [Caeruleum heppii]|nr:MAG: hypothetical protein M1817_002417 [Caeruleum heppii]
MVAIHVRTRSEMSFAELSLYEKVEVEHIDEDDSSPTKEEVRTYSKQLTMIYVLFLAEAIMASSLQPQLKMLINTDDFCGSLSTSYLRSVLDCAYTVGGVAGLFWGRMSDRIGRRPVALIGIFGLSICCLSMGFATNVLSVTIFRLLAGLTSASIAVTTLTMIGDISQSASERVINVSRLPLVALCGSVGPVVQGVVGRSLNAYGAVWERFPLLSSQIVCASMVFLVALAIFMLLEETLPGLANPARPITLDAGIDCEKAPFLGQARGDDLGNPRISIVDAAAPSPLALCQILQAPSLVILLGSFSLLSLHSATFDSLLPHLGHSPTHHGGMGLPCSLLGLVVLMVRVVAGILVFVMVPKAVERIGLLHPYRLFAMVTPAVYIVTPALAYVFTSSTTSTALSSTAALLTKNAVTTSAQVLVAILVLDASPDAFSSGTIVGLMHSASLVKALAAGVSGASFYYSSEVSVVTTNVALWAVLVCISVGGAVAAWFVRDHPIVNQDFPAEVLKWEVAFDAGAEGYEQV